MEKKILVQSELINGIFLFTEITFFFLPKMQLEFFFVTASMF